MENEMYLVLDGDEVMRQRVVMLLDEISDAEVKKASSGSEALAVIEQSPAQTVTIILDLSMPQMDCIQLFQALAARDFAGRLVLVSDLDERVVRGVLEIARSYQLNVAATLSKPVDMLALGEALQVATPSRMNSQNKTTPLMFDDLFNAVLQRQLEPYYQPLVDIRNNAVVGIEALARWNHNTLGMISPDIFIPMAEREGIIRNLTFLMFEQVLVDFKELRERECSIYLSFNLSPLLLNSATLPDELMDRVEQHGISPSDITFEITEGFDITTGCTPLETLSRLRLKGFGLALDDFGTGYAAMNNLLHMPFTQIKIDRSFVSGAEQNKVAKTVLRSCLNMANELALEVVCEGVEDSADFSLVEELGGSIAQGRLMGEALPYEQLTQHLAAADNVVKTAIQSINKAYPQLDQGYSRVN